MAKDVNTNPTESPVFNLHDDISNDKFCKEDPVVYRLGKDDQPNILNEISRNIKSDKNTDIRPRISESGYGKLSTASLIFVVMFVALSLITLSYVATNLLDGKYNDMLGIGNSDEHSYIYYEDSAREVFLKINPKMDLNEIISVIGKPSHSPETDGDGCTFYEWVCKDGDVEYIPASTDNPVNYIYLYDRVVTNHFENYEALEITITDNMTVAELHNSVIGDLDNYLDTMSYNTETDVTAYVYNIALENGDTLNIEADDGVITNIILLGDEYDQGLKELYRID